MSQSKQAVDEAADLLTALAARAESFARELAERTRELAEALGRLDDAYAAMRMEWRELLAAKEQAERELAGAREDAERYRWARDQCDGPGDVYIALGRDGWMTPRHLICEAADRAIDAARAAQNAGGKT